MADVTTVDELVDYYTGLLIIQYANKPKAQATIALIVRTLLANAVFLDVLNGYDVDTAIGVQLDVIGKYVGITRHYDVLNLINFFSFTDYIEADPTPQPRWGFSSYANYSQFSYNGTLTYNQIATIVSSLDDDDFRTLILLGIMRNNSDFGHGEIDAGIEAILGNTIRMESDNHMRMAYFFNTAITPLMLAIIAQNVLPKPMGVQLSYVQQNDGQMFGFTDYSLESSPFENGFTNYSGYATTTGEILSYNQIITGTQ